MKTKRCSGCDNILPISEYSKNKAKKDGLQTRCKECAKKSSRKYYEKNIDEVKSRNNKRRKEYHGELKEWINQLKIDLKGCVVCGESDPVCLDFHKVKPSKENSIAYMVHDKLAKERIEDELKNCKLMCANCIKKYEAKNNS